MSLSKSVIVFPWTAAASALTSDRDVLVFSTLLSRFTPNDACFPSCNASQVVLWTVHRSPQMTWMRQRHLLTLSYSHTHIRKTSFRQQGLDLTWQTSNIYLRTKSCFGTMGIFHTERANHSFPPFCIHNCQSCVAALTWWIFFSLFAPKVWCEVRLVNK